MIPHLAWVESRSALLKAPSGGPTTLALLGEPGTGKTWLLWHLETILLKLGHPVTLLRQGDLPWQLNPGTVLLIDEASRLTPQALAMLAAQRSMIVILADVPKFAATIEEQSPPPRIIRLPRLGADQVAEFVTRWLLLSGRAADTVTPDGMRRLAVHSLGTPRLITQLLSAAFVFAADSARINDAAIDDVATMRWNAAAAGPQSAQADPAATQPPCPPYSRRTTALAATALLAIYPAEVPNRAEAAPATLPGTSVARRWTRGLESASVPAPQASATVAITTLTVASPDPASALPPPVASAAPIAEPLPEVNTSDQPSDTELLAVDTGVVKELEPGLILIARRGDTLLELSSNPYTPSFEDIVAANPRPALQGSAVFFPAPLGGWSRE